jgi:4-amino-4-deoxy-L-arabinose transferase-like glycosyltransferase
MSEGVHEVPRGAARWREGMGPLLLIVLAHLVLAALLFDPLPYTGGDDSVYLSLAHGMVHGRYVDLFDPALPPHTQYPPVFPGLLALFVLVGIGSTVALKVVMVGCSAAAVGLSYLWIRERSGRTTALVAGLILALSPGVGFWSHWVLSDVPFWALLMLALWLFERWDRRCEPRLLAGGIAATVLALFTRPAGLPFLMAVSAWLLVRRRPKALAALLLVALPLSAAWFEWGHLHGGIGPFAEFRLRDPYTPAAGIATLGEILTRVPENTRAYALVRLPALLVVGSPAVRSMLLVYLGSFALTALAVMGWVRSMRKLGVAELFLPLYLGLFLVWPPVWADDRFLLPVLPLLLAYAALTLRVLTGGMGAGRRRLLLLLLPALWLANNLPGLVSSSRYRLACAGAFYRGETTVCLTPAWAAFFRVAELSRTRLPADAVVLSRKPAIFYQLSGRRGRIYPFTPDSAAFFRAAGEAGARYLVVDQIANQAMRYLFPVMRGSRARFCVRTDLSTPGALMLQIRTPAAALLEPPRAPGPPTLPVCSPHAPGNVDSASPDSYH